MGLISREELRRMQGLAQELWRREPTHVDITVGELAYTWGVRNADYSAEWRHHFWVDGGRCIAWGWLFLPGSLEWQVHPDHPDLLDDVLDWFEAETEGARRETTVRAANQDAIDRLERREFIVNGDAPWMQLNVRDLSDIEEPWLPDGFRLRTMRELDGGVAARVSVHQESWREFGTHVTDVTYPRVMETWPYRDDLDLVVEGPDGRLVAFALAWYDDANRVGEFEPVGTDPRFRRQGLGRAVNLFGLQRLRDVGATHAIVQCRGDNGHPVPRHLYESVGFSAISRQYRYEKGYLLSVR